LPGNCRKDGRSRSPPLPTVEADLDGEGLPDKATPITNGHRIKLLAFVSVGEVHLKDRDQRRVLALTNETVQVVFVFHKGNARKIWLSE
jgi:hypothetical protein